MRIRFRIEKVMTLEDVLSINEPPVHGYAVQGSFGKARIENELFGCYAEVGYNLTKELTAVVTYFGGYLYRRDEDNPKIWDYYGPRNGFLRQDLLPHFPGVEIVEVESTTGLFPSLEAYKALGLPEVVKLKKALVSRMKEEFVEDIMSSKDMRKSIIDRCFDLTVSGYEGYKCKLYKFNEEKFNRLFK